MDDIPGLEDQHPVATKLACIMVGLPARGKTYVARKIARYLAWLGHRSRIFNVGNYRRNAVGANQPHDFFDPLHPEGVKRRMEVAVRALEDMLMWFEKADEVLPNGATRDDTAPSPMTQRPRSDSLCGLGRSTSAYIAVYDATNSTKERRKILHDRCVAKGVKVMFIESICDQEEIILANIKEVKISSPDYAGVDPEKAVEDFKRRIDHYAGNYETLKPDECDGQISFVKVVNVGDQVIVNKVKGFLGSRVVYFLMNLNITPKSFYFTRHGESMFNVAGKIGGDADLSPQGHEFARRLPGLIRDKLGPDTNLTIWTSTLKRTVQTARFISFPLLQWKQLDELDSGVCDGLTYEEIAAKYPDDFNERDQDKFNYRYHGGESYRDLVQRLEPVIMELERHHEPNHSILIVGHQAVLRAIYAYFLNYTLDELPYVKIPLHTVVRLTPKAYGCQEEHFAVDVPAVDTHRPMQHPVLNAKVRH
ncbi:histidine phosphatase superfamily [Gaertneriomyces semiglobifer]|nr:histidine phosphatase superfamily [Gaertneriomyces semiglobifer]